MSQYYDAVVEISLPDLIQRKEYNGQEAVK